MAANKSEQDRRADQERLLQKLGEQEEKIASDVVLYWSSLAQTMPEHIREWIVVDWLTLRGQLWSDDQGVWHVDKDGLYSLINQIAQKLTQYAQED